MARKPKKSDFNFSGKWVKKEVVGWRKQPTIYLFRHAQTVFNKNHYFTGWLDSKLTPFGRVQAKVVARKLANKEIDVAICTSLSRSKDTLSAVLTGETDGHTHSPIALMISRLGRRPSNSA